MTARGNVISPPPAPENSVVIVDHDNAEYMDPDVKAVLQDFGDSAGERRQAL
jgi:hypothetical protein